MIAGMSAVAEWVVSVIIMLGTLAFVLFCLLGLGRGAWLFVRTAWPQARHRRPARGFEVLPVKRQRQGGTRGRGE